MWAAKQRATKGRLSAAVVHRSLADARAVSVLPSQDRGSLYGDDAGREAIQTDAGRD